MSFKLNIDFAGMCLLVHDKTGNKLRVLLPKTGIAGSAHGDHADHPSGTGEAGGLYPEVPPHVARLVYDSAREQRGGSTSTELKKRPLEGISLELTKLPSNSIFRPDMPRQVVDLVDATSTPVSSSLFHGDGGGRLTSRISLARGEAKLRHPGGRWRFPSASPRPMAIAVRWMLEIEGDSLQLEMNPMDTTSPGQSLELFPGPRGTLDLYVFHSPENEIPDRLPPPYGTGRRPIPGDEATHFRAYYQLIDGLEESPPAPLYVDEGEPAESGEEGDTKGILGLKFTCMTATATV